jgi:hypothetical protein
MNSGTEPLISLAAATLKDNIKFYDCLFLQAGTNQYVTFFTTLDGCFFKSTASNTYSAQTAEIAGTPETHLIQYCRFDVNNSGAVIATGATDYSIKFNKITNTGLAFLTSSTAAVTIVGTEFNYNTITQNAFATTTAYIGLGGENPDCIGNSITITGIGQTSTNNQGIIIYATGKTAVEITDNEIDLSGYGYASVISLGHSSTSTLNPVISRNKIYLKNSIAAHFIVIGGETVFASQNKYDGFVIADNLCYGPAYYSSTMFDSEAEYSSGTTYSLGTVVTVSGSSYQSLQASNTNHTPSSSPTWWGSRGSHGIFIAGYDGTIKNNYINGSWTGIGMKGLTSSAVGNSIDFDTFIYNNLFVNCNRGIIISGASGVEVNQNTIYQDDNLNNQQQAFLILKQTTYNNASINTIFKNNIININEAGISNSLVFYTDLIADTTGMDMNNNQVYLSGATDLFYITTTGYTFTEWQALTFDVNSVNSDITFTSAANEEYWPVTLITIGSTLGSPYNSGLDITNIFGEATVTKLRTAPYQIGCYVK